MWLVNLSGRPSVRYGIPLCGDGAGLDGVRGARFPALIRGIVAIFWYGVQTYFASTAVALALQGAVRDRDDRRRGRRLSGPRRG